MLPMPLGRIVIVTRALCVYNKRNALIKWTAWWAAWTADGGQQVTTGTKRTIGTKRRAADNRHQAARSGQRADAER